MYRIHQVALAVCLAAGLAIPAAAQTSGTVSQSDIQRLQDNVYNASSDISQLRSRDSARASQLQSELDDLRDEVVYLKVKLRKERSLPRSEYVDVRCGVERRRPRVPGHATHASSRTSGRTSTASPSTGTATTGSAAASCSTRRATAGTQSGMSIPAGTELDVRLLNTLNSG